MTPGYTPSLLYPDLLGPNCYSQLYSLYLEPCNFSTLTTVQYCNTSIPLVNYVLAREYRTAALEELCKFRPGGVIKADDIYADADAAFAALATLLIEQDGEWFFGSQEPGLFDAAVFAYTHLILTLPWDEKGKKLVGLVRKHEVLVEHEQRVWKWTNGRARSRSQPKTPRR